MSADNSVAKLLHEERLAELAALQPPRGRCAECGYSFRLRTNGTVQAHRLFCGSDRLPECAGSGLLPAAVLRPPTPEGGERAGE